MQATGLIMVAVEPLIPGAPKAPGAKRSLRIGAQQGSNATDLALLAVNMTAQEVPCSWTLLAWELGANHELHVTEVAAHGPPVQPTELSRATLTPVFELVKSILLYDALGVRQAMGDLLRFAKEGNYDIA